MAIARERAGGEKMRARAGGGRERNVLEWTTREDWTHRASGDEAGDDFFVRAERHRERRGRGATRDVVRYFREAYNKNTQRNRRQRLARSHPRKTP